MNRLSKTFLVFLLAATTFCLLNTFGVQSYAKPAVQEEEETEYSVEEYEDYEQAVKEPDLDKRAALLLAYYEEYPESTLLTYIDSAYQTLLYEYATNQNWEKLEPIADQWLEMHPNDKTALAFVAQSAQNLGNNEKCLECLEEIYEIEPTATLAYDITQLYKEMDDEAKYLEWVQILFTYPEFDAEFPLRYEFVQKHIKEKNLAKATEYARLTLKSLEQAEKPETTSEKEWRQSISDVRRACNYTIGTYQYENGKFADAIKYFQNALKAEDFSEGYYYIGMCQWKMDNIEDAMVAFATAELLGGSLAEQAKGHLEKLYRALHNNTTIGIDKVYRKAKQLAGDERVSQDGP